MITGNNNNNYENQTVEEIIEICQTIALVLLAAVFILAVALSWGFLL